MESKHIIISILLVMALVFTLPAAVQAAKTFDGWMQGLNCVIHETQCPLDKLDPHIALESDFVLFMKSGEYWILPNIAKVVKAKYVGDAIRVTGQQLGKYAAINVVKLEVKQGGSYKTVWTWKQQQAEMAEAERDWDAP